MIVNLALALAAFEVLAGAAMSKSASHATLSKASCSRHLPSQVGVMRHLAG
jgi:hypothetical protein